MPCPLIGLLISINIEIDHAVIKKISGRSTSQSLFDCSPKAVIVNRLPIHTHQLVNRDSIEIAFGSLENLGNTLFKVFVIVEVTVIVGVESESCEHACSWDVGGAGTPAQKDKGSWSGGDW